MVKSILISALLFCSAAPVFADGYIGVLIDTVAATAQAVACLSGQFSVTIRRLTARYP